MNADFAKIIEAFANTTNLDLAKMQKVALSLPMLPILTCAVGLHRTCIILHHLEKFGINFCKPERLVCLVGLGDNAILAMAFQG